MKQILSRAIRITSTLATVLVAGSALRATDIVPGSPQGQPIAIVGATIHAVSAPPIENGTIIFEAGRITAVGADVSIPDEAQRIDAAGKHVYPALFDAHTQLGLVEINSVRATLDMEETGELNPNVEAWKAVNPDSEAIPVTRANGVLLALVAPSGGLLAGRSAVMQLDGWTWEDLTLHAPAAMHVNWPRMRPARNAREGDPSGEERRERDETLRRLEDLFTQAEAYHNGRSAEASQQAFDARLGALGPVVAGDLPVVVRADDLEQIQSAVAFAARHKVRLVLFGGYDAEEAAGLLKEHDVPVIVGGVYRLPERRGDDYDAAYTLPERLRKAGVRFCISGESRFAASNVRNLPYHAATAAAFGLPQEEALRAVTLSPAEILGVADRVGSLEAGKDATLFIANGDILETPTHVEEAFIQGRRVDLDNRHKRLYRKYRERLKQGRSE
jgi:imidazolonepropionase-like amidohydrolase